MQARWIVVLALVISSAVPGDAQPKELGRAPLCEASAALRLSCGEGDCLIVGDNEIRDALYQFPILNPGLDAQAGKELPLGNVEISDIESLVDLGSNRILVLGSHSRDKSCDPKRNRRRFLAVERSEHGVKAASGIIESGKIQCQRLLGGAPLGGGILGAVCNAIDASERRADSIFDALGTAGEQATEEACGKAAPFNIEGAVAIPAQDGPEVWVGLRGPLVEMNPSGASRRLAVMLRMKDQEALHFDAAALVDLGGLAIRELAIGGGWVWGIAGPPEDSSAAFRLWRFPIRSLQPEATVLPELLGELPTSSEGLALAASTAFVIIDGDQGGDTCAEPARYQTIRVPN
jgi:hypothetical protein